MTLVPCASAIEQETQTWTAAQVLLPVTTAVDASLRYRTRFSGFFDKRQLYQYQFTAGYKPAPDLRVLLGYELFRTPAGKVEHRLFPELQLQTQGGTLPLTHRLRLELNDIKGVDTTTYRLRYRLAHRRRINSSGAYLELRNEIFVSLSEIQPILERGITQNRVGFTLGQPLSERSRLEFRYQWGYIDNVLVERGDHLIQLHWIWDGR